jgi:luciferase family oxidoreductase group 1
VIAVPGEGQEVPVWILGSSLYGAQLAAHLGLPFAFASHFAPAQLDQALLIYRERFQPSEVLDRPHVMAAMMVICADTDEEAALLSTSGDQSFVALRTGNPGRLKPPVPGYRDSLPPEIRAGLDFARSASATGSPVTVRAQLQAFIERTQADEIIIAGTIWDPKARERSLQLTIAALT